MSQTSALVWSNSSLGVPPKMTEITPEIKPGHRPSGRALRASGSGLMAIKLANAALGFATVTVFARFLPPENYGLYVLALTLAQVLALPLQMGLPALLKREIAIAIAEDRPNVVRGVQVWARRIITVGTLILGSAVIGIYALVVAAGWPILQSFSWPLVLMIVALIPVIAEMKRVMGALAGFKRVAQGLLPDGLVRPILLLAAGAAGLAFADWNESELLAAYLGAAAIAAGIGIMLADRAQTSAIRDAAPEIHARDWWRAIGPLTIFSAAGAIKTYADILMLGALSDTESVAHYRIAVQIAGLALMGQVVINQALAPWIAAMHARGDLAGVQKIAVLGSRFTFAAAAAFSTMLVLIGENNFSILLGSEYAAVYGLAVWLAVGQAGVASVGGTVLILNMTRREDASMRYAVTTAIANIVLNAILIPVLGAMGAVIATIITNMTMQGLAWNLVRKESVIRADAFAKIRN